jgi:hypothetical protein
VRTSLIPFGLCLAAFGFANAAVAQETPLKVEFFVNDRPSTKKVEVILHAGEVATKLSQLDDGSFSMPAFPVEWIDVQVISGKYDLLYSHIYLKKLSGELTFRVFTSEKWLRRLTDRDDLGCKPGQKWLSSLTLISMTERM